MRLRNRNGRVGRDKEGCFKKIQLTAVNCFYQTIRSLEMVQTSEENSE